MKGASLSPGDYVYFKSRVPLHKISVGAKQWRYYDFGPKDVPPLICIPGIAGTADVFYKQIMFLSMKGYRVISIDIPRVWNHHEWIHAFEKFLDAINVHHVHLYGTSLGGFLSQLFAQHRPRRVKSLVLSNTFLDTHKFSAAMPWSSVYVFPSQFTISKVETLSRDDLASRLTLNANAVAVGALLLSDSFITIMDTNDYCAIPQQLKDQVSERYLGARRAILKTGGDFPFLSRPDEVNLHLQLHLRRVGVEAKLDLVQSTSKDGTAGSSSGDERKGDKRFDNPPDDNGNTGHDGMIHQPEEPLGSGSSAFDEHLLSNARLSGFVALHTILILMQASSSVMPFIRQKCIAINVQ